MIKKLAERVVDWQLKKNYLKEGERGLYEYAYEILINQMINILISILIAILLRAPMPVFVFLLSYIPLRSYCGGYHARTNEVCTIVSAILVCMVCLVFKALPSPVRAAIQPLSMALSGFLILRYAPVEDSNKPLSDAETTRYRTRGQLIWLVEACICMLLFFLNEQAGVVLALSHLIFSLMLCVGILKNKKMKTASV